MPAEPTKAKLKRRTSRKDFDEYRFDGSHARELELKRNRGAPSSLIEIFFVFDVWAWNLAGEVSGLMQGCLVTY